MSRFTQAQLKVIAEALFKEGFPGAASSIHWWNCLTSGDPTIKSFPAMCRPEKEMPLFLNDGDETQKIIAIKRMELGI